MLARPGLQLTAGAQAGPVWGRGRWLGALAGGRSRDSFPCDCLFLRPKKPQPSHGDPSHKIARQLVIHLSGDTELGRGSVKMKGSAAGPRVACKWVWFLA